MSQIEPQKRARRISMTDEERDSPRAELRVCRIGTIGVDGGPHVSALWYCWDGAALWLYSLIKSQRWVNLQRDHRVSVVVDQGVDYFELRGVEFIGEVEFVGEQPRAGDPNPELEEPERLFAERYSGGSWPGHDPRPHRPPPRPPTQGTRGFRTPGGA